ncbi:CAF1 family protein [Heterostelium album PN500]|uniref:poly(A)-specific ribonuclease n=1 Tax=Heterostelium pallidum (strain ATCC 26659 / Pp 5 / PN500) TaxID=670386 RepID=D3B3S7_HETP5|nr:CAF1 family protein [Heterostelium album PN500]EFA83975.1 CAF1 family protein [Heterostelium album PN500]|eukprot:XP_020436092.1 CAF1 family protein [Heterostelium album PN500]
MDSKNNNEKQQNDDITMSVEQADSNNNNNNSNEDSFVSVSSSQDSTTDLLTGFKREQEFFSWHPLAFIDDVNEAVFEITAIDAADYIEHCLQTHLSPDPQTLEKISQGANKAWNILDESFKKNLDKFELFLLSNVFKIPDDLVLPNEQFLQNSNQLSQSVNQSPSNSNNNNNNNRNIDHHQIDKQIDDLKLKIAKHDSNEKRKKNKLLESEIELLKSWDSILNVSQTTIEKEIIPTFNNINHKRRDLSYSFNLIKKRLAENNINIESSTTSATSSSSLPSSTSPTSLESNINNLTLNEFIRDKPDVERNTKEMSAIQNHLYISKFSINIYLAYFLAKLCEIRFTVKQTISIITYSNHKAMVTLATDEIREVWAHNLEEEMAIIRDLIEDYNYIAMDTEFPGIVTRPVGSYRTSSDYHYQTLRLNVDLLKIIQLGLTFADSEGNLANHTCTWQFNFKFNLNEDMYAQDSIDLLSRSGIEFKKNEENGIDVLDFGELLMSSGIVLNDKIKWISFHSGYDFGYLIKLLTCTALPVEEPDFFDLVRTYFPCIYDIKYLMKSCKNLKGGLSELAEDLDIKRIGPQHQAGSDSLLTCTTFFKMRKMYFENQIDDSKYQGILYGLTSSFTQDNSSSNSSSSNSSSNTTTTTTTNNSSGTGTSNSTNSTPNSSHQSISNYSLLQNITQSISPLSSSASSTTTTTNNNTTNAMNGHIYYIPNYKSVTNHDNESQSTVTVTVTVVLVI